MPQTKILIDSNCYLRLAQSIHPLLQYKFPWVLKSEYVANRKCKMTISKQQRKEIAANLDFIQGTARSQGSNVSVVDARALAVAMALGVRIVTKIYE